MKLLTLKEDVGVVHKSIHSIRLGLGLGDYD